MAESTGTGSEAPANGDPQPGPESQLDHPPRPTPDSAPESQPGRFTLDGEVTLFGFDPSPARATIIARTKAWRLGGAARTFAIFFVIAPFVMIFPPHAVWPIGMLMTGGALARRRYIERFTLVELDAVCPKCGKAYQIKSGRLHIPHSLPCDGCHHESSLRFPDGALEERAQS